MVTIEQARQTLIRHGQPGPDIQAYQDDECEACARVVQALRPNWHMPECNCTECLTVVAAARAIRQRKQERNR